MTTREEFEDLVDAHRLGVIHGGVSTASADLLAAFDSMQAEVERLTAEAERLTKGRADDAKSYLLAIADTGAQVRGAEAAREKMYREKLAAESTVSALRAEFDAYRNEREPAYRIRAEEAEARVGGLVSTIEGLRHDMENAEARGIERAAAHVAGLWVHSRLTPAQVAGSIRSLLPASTPPAPSDATARQYLTETPEEWKRRTGWNCKPCRHFRVAGPDDGECQIDVEHVPPEGCSRFSPSTAACCADCDHLRHHPIHRASMNHPQQHAFVPAAPGQGHGEGSDE